MFLFVSNYKIILQELIEKNDLGTGNVIKTTLEGVLDYYTLLQIK